MCTGPSSRDSISPIDSKPVDRIVLGCGVDQIRKLTYTPHPILDWANLISLISCYTAFVPLNLVLSERDKQFKSSLVLVLIFVDEVLPACYIT